MCVYIYIYIYIYVYMHIHNPAPTEYQLEGNDQDSNCHFHHTAASPWHPKRWEVEQCDQNCASLWDCKMCENHFRGHGIIWKLPSENNNCARAAYLASPGIFKVLVWHWRQIHRVAENAMGSLRCEANSTSTCSGMCGARAANAWGGWGPGTWGPLGTLW